MDVWSKDEWSYSDIQYAMIGGQIPINQMVFDKDGFISSYWLKDELMNDK